jgi:predicted acyltransferase
MRDMQLKNKRRLWLAAALLQFSFAALAADPHPVVSYTKPGKFAEVRDRLPRLRESHA